MNIKFSLAALAFLALSPFVYAQQTGVAVSTPGGAIRNFPKPVPVPIAKPSCDSRANFVATSAFPALPDMIFTREDLICVRHSDGRSEQLLNNVETGVISADGAFIAHWVADTRELHIFSVADHHDAMADTLPGAKIAEMAWSLKGHALSYYVVDEKNRFGAGVRVLDLDSGHRNALPGAYLSLVASPDPDYAYFHGSLSFERFRLSDGHRDIILPARNVEHAFYSSKGSYLGVIAYTTAKYLNKVPEPSPASSDADDEPDCTGADFFLVLQSSATKQLIDIPFPEKFNTIHDFEFSPDESAIAVSFGVTGCDYPGEAARVYRVSLPSLEMTPMSPVDRLAVRVHWSPDGRYIIYSDFTEGELPLVAADVRTGKVARLTSPGINGPDGWLGWR